MGHFLGFDPLEKTDSKFKRTSIVEAKKIIRESMKILIETERKIDMLDSSVFYGSEQLQEWFSHEMEKIKKLLDE